MNLCTACGEDFGGVQAFDAHRVGKHAYCYSPARTDGRRCLTRTELAARGLWLNSRGRWSLPQSRRMDSSYRHSPDEAGRLRRRMRV
jgi:hypothetical protein